MCNAMDSIRNRLHKYTLVDEEVKTNVVPGKWSALWRATCCVMTVFLLMSAYVQLNDPDPWLWIPAYLIPALLTGVVIFRRDITSRLSWKIICDATVVLSSVNAIYLFMVLTGILKENFINPLEHEEGREFAGTLVVIFWLLAVRSTRLENFDPNTMGMAVVVMILGCLATIPTMIWAACFHKSFGPNLGHCKDMFPGMLGDKFKDEQ